MARKQKECAETGCTKQALKGGKCKRHGGGKRCEFNGCNKSARGKTSYCVTHGGGKRCEFDGCDKSAVGNTSYCKRHGGGKRCEFNGCNKSARGKTSYCVAHGGGKRCESDGCDKSAVGNTSYCIAHGGGKRCTFEGCKKGAEGKTSYCVTHGGGKRCAFYGCTKSAVGNTSYCVAHGGGKRCESDGCDKSAVGNTSYCIAHGGGIRCSGCGLWSVKAEGAFCHTCRIGTTRYKQQESMVKEFLDTHTRLRMYSYYDQTLPCAPNRRKPDFTWLVEDRFVVLEVDEDAHRYYERSCEISRITELHEQGQGRPLLLLRFNPKRRLLVEMAQKIETFFDCKVPNMLEVAFLGYPTKREYNAVEEIIAESTKRARRDQ